jgi:hypothetical protein
MVSLLDFMADGILAQGNGILSNSLAVADKGQLSGGFLNDNQLRLLMNIGPAQGRQKTNNQGQKKKLFRKAAERPAIYRFFTA